MTRSTFGFVALLILIPALQAQDKAEKPTPEQQYQKLVREYDKAIEEDEKKQKRIDNLELFNATFAQRFLTLAKNNPKTPVAMKALTQIIFGLDVNYDPQSPRMQALRILLRDHVESEKIITVCQILQMFKSDVESRKLLHAVLERNPHRSAKAEACRTLAQHAEGNINVARLLKEEPDKVKEHKRFMGKEYVAALLKAKPEELRKEVEVLYERMAKDFTDVPRLITLTMDEKGDSRTISSSSTLGEIAKAKLEALRHPVLVGKPAPEIEGKDIEGKKFKLSDYRGKIVFLDFWGIDTSPVEMYEYERSLVKRMEGKPFVLIGVNSDLDRGELKKVMLKEKITWRSFMDGGGSNFGGPIATRWDRPRLLLIDAKGVIRHKYEEHRDDKELDQEIDKLIAEVEKKAAK